MVDRLQKDTANGHLEHLAAYRIAVPGLSTSPDPTSPSPRPTACAYVPLYVPPLSGASIDSFTCAAGLIWGITESLFPGSRAMGRWLMRCSQGSDAILAVAYELFWLRVAPGLAAAYPEC